MPSNYHTDWLRDFYNNRPMRGRKRVCSMHEERMMKWFEYAHLPPHLQEVSKPFGLLAEGVCMTCEPGPERTVALRKLLEAKDAAVRAKLNPGG